MNQCVALLGCTFSVFKSSVSYTLHHFYCKFCTALVVYCSLEDWEVSDLVLQYCTKPVSRHRENHLSVLMAHLSSLILFVHFGQMNHSMCVLNFVMRACIYLKVRRELVLDAIRVRG